MFDIGYLGVGKDFPDLKSSLPNRKKRTKIYLKMEKSATRSHSRKRIVIKHTICRMKKYRIMGDAFRNRLRDYDKVSDIVSELANYRTLSSF